MMAANTLDEILQSLRHAFEQAYERGAKDTFNRLIGTINGVGREPTLKARSKKTASRKRAPRGTARALILRVLSEKKTGARFPEIIAAAKTTAEKSATSSAIRLELYKGKKERRYRNSNGTWSLPIRK
jgi:hypothetical protein